MARRITCMLDTCPYASGKLFTVIEQNKQAFSYKDFLDIKVNGNETIVGADFDSIETAIIWTDNGRIYHLNFLANSYTLLGKPGAIYCCKYFMSDFPTVVVGLKTKRVIVIDVRSRKIISRFMEIDASRISDVQTSQDNKLISVLTPEYLAIYSPMKRDNCRIFKLKFSSEKSATFARLLSVNFIGGSSTDSYKLMVGCKSGDLAIWSLKLDTDNSGNDDNVPFLKAELVSAFSIGQSINTYCLLSNGPQKLFCCSQRKLWMIDVEAGAQISQINFVPDTKICHFSVFSRNNEIVLVVTTELGTSIISDEGQIIGFYKSEDNGRKIFSNDCSSMLSLQSNGSLLFCKTDSVIRLSSPPEEIPILNLKQLIKESQPSTSRSQIKYGPSSKSSHIPSSSRLSQKNILQKVTQNNFSSVLASGRVGRGFFGAYRSTETILR